MNAPAIIRCAGITKWFDDTSPAVKDVSFELKEGEILSLLGPSGCGKTTILRLIAGFERLDSGEISVQEKLVSGEHTHTPPELRNVGMVFQEYALFPHMTVEQNVSFGLQDMAGRERDNRLSEVLELVRLGDLRKRYPYELSGGQQQRVALARTLAPRPVTILLDEPFSNLDASMRSEMRYEVGRILRDNAISTIFVTHDRDEAFAMADRVGIMSNGVLEQLDSPDVIYHRPVNPSVARLAGVCDFLPGKVVEGGVKTELGVLPFVHDDGVLAKESFVDILVHPDDFRIVAEDSGNATIMSREFRGGETVFAVETPGGTLLRCREHSYSRVQEGAKVRLESIKAEPYVAFKKP